MTGTAVTVAVPKCRFCGESHDAICPHVHSMEFYPNGELKRVYFFRPAWNPSQVTFGLSGGPEDAS